MTLASIICRNTRKVIQMVNVSALLLHLKIFHTKYGGSHARKCLRNVDFI